MLLHHSKYIRKQGHPGRSFVFSNSNLSEHISYFFDHHLHSLVTKLPSYIKDTTHFLSKLNNLGQFANGVLLATIELTSLYTNVPIRTKSNLAVTSGTSLGVTGGEGGECTVCAGSASSVEESVSPLTTDGQKSVTSDGIL